MKKIIVILSVIALLAVTLYSVKNTTVSNKVQKSNHLTTSTNSSNSGIQINKNTLKIKAPNISLKDLDGNQISLSDLKGKNVYLNFWATWCPPCRGEMPDIEKLYQETKNTDLVILAVNLGEDKDTVKSFISSNKYNFKVLLDSDKAAAALYNISAIPSSFFIDKNGDIVATKIGAMSIEEMKAYVAALNK